MNSLGDTTKITNNYPYEKCNSPTLISLKTKTKENKLPYLTYASFILYGKDKDANQRQHFESEKLIHKYATQKSKNFNTLAKEKSFKVLKL